MRDSRIIIAVVVIALLEACKPSVPTSSTSSSYYEDLSHLRPATDKGDSVIQVSTNPGDKSVAPFPKDIKVEMDSISKMVVANNAERRVVDGFMIQIYTGNDREEAYQARAIANALDSSLDPQISYHSPGFKVKVGPYFDKLKAHQVYQSLKSEFSRALLIPERIEVDYD